MKYLGDLIAIRACVCVKRVIQFRRGYREAHDGKVIVSSLWTDWRDFICSSVLPFETAMQ